MDWCDLQEAWRADGRGLFELRPRGRRPLYGPVLYLEPHTDINRTVIGFDLYSEAIRQQAMRMAMDSGQSQLTGRITLGRDAARPAPAFLLFTPVYGQSLDVESSATRRSAIRGWVFAPFRMDDMLRTALSPGRGKMQLRVVDVTNAGHDVLYQDAGIDAPHTFTHSLAMDVLRAALALRFLLRAGRDRRAAAGGARQAAVGRASRFRCCCSRWRGCSPRPRRARDAWRPT